MAESKGLTDSVVVNAGEDAVMNVLLDFESYSDWMSNVVEMEVLSRDKKKRGTKVKYTIDILVKTISYVLSYTYSDDRIDIGYVEGELDDCNSYYEFADLGSERTEVTYHYDVTYSLPKALNNPVSRRMLKTVDKRVMNSALKDLKKRVESLK